WRFVAPSETLNYTPADGLHSALRHKPRRHKCLVDLCLGGRRRVWCSNDKDVCRRRDVRATLFYLKVTLKELIQECPVGRNYQYTRPLVRLGHKDLRRTGPVFAGAFEHQSILDKS